MDKYHHSELPKIYNKFFSRLSLFISIKPDSLVWNITAFGVFQAMLKQTQFP